MLFRVFMLLSLSAARAYGQGFVCGYEPSGDEVSGRSSHSAFYQSSTAADPIKVLILFGKFPGEADPSNLRPPTHATKTSKFSGGTHEIV